MPGRTLPDYDRPPAQETWMSFRFSPLEWQIPYFGAFWNEIRSEYPTFEVHPPLGEFRVEFDSTGADAIVTLPVRCWFLSNENNRLLQVQNNRFFQNWRRPSPEAEYLHYSDLRPRFAEEWQRFCDFANRHGLGSPNVLQGEVSYINHLERGLGWNNYSELDVIFPSAGNLRGRRFTGAPETTSVTASYVMPSHDGRLRVVISPAVRQSDGKEIIQFSVTASGRPAANGTAELFACLDQCHDWVIEGFDDLTSDKMHEIWGRSNG